VEKVNDLFRDLFITNQRRVNIKLKSQNHEATDDFKDANKLIYQKQGVAYKDVTDLKTLYPSLPKMQNLIKTAQKKIHYKVLYDKKFRSKSLKKLAKLKIII
jgi:hypothetical protein